MKTYIQIVETARKSNSSRILTNAAPSHAKILIQNLLIAARSAEENVKIVTGEFSEEVYDSSIADEMKATLDAGCSFDVIVTDAAEDDLGDSLVYQALKTVRDGDHSGRANIRFAGDAFSEISHFVLVGENKYRLEPDPTEISAIASFNDSDTGQLIDGLFDQAVSILEEAAAGPAG